MKYTVLILGKLPPPFMGPSIATSILLNSELKSNFNLIHLDTRAHKDINQLGKIRFNKLFKNISIYFKLYKLITREQPDLVLIPISQTNIGFIKDSFFIWVCRLKGAKVLIQLRGSGFRHWVENTQTVVRKYVDYTLSYPKGVIVLGEKLRYLFENYFKNEQIHVAPNGANYELPAHNYTSDHPVRLIYLANLQSSKGIEDVIEAMIFLKKITEFPFTLDVVGNWRNRETEHRCKLMVTKNQLPVTFHGPATGQDKFEFLMNSEVFIFTPRESEGHPWVIIEAMAAGLPIISTDQGAITESVIDGMNGFIVDSKSPKQIADRCFSLISNHSKRHEMGSISRSHYLKNFTESKLVDNYTNIFKKAISYNS